MYTGLPANASSTLSDVTTQAVTYAGDVVPFVIGFMLSLAAFFLAIRLVKRVLGIG